MLLDIITSFYTSARLQDRHGPGPDVIQAKIMIQIRNESIVTLLEMTDERYCQL